MRINKFVAQATSLSRRAADLAITEGRVTVNENPATNGVNIIETDIVKLDGQTLATPAATTTVILNKPTGYVCSRKGQGSRTVYDLLPATLHHLKPVGRLDKDSSGLLLLTDDGDLANRLTHPRYSKEKVYQISLDKPLSLDHEQQIGRGVDLDDGLSRLEVKKLDMGDEHWQITMHEGRNRQIRRTFAALGYTVKTLRRTRFGPYSLDQLAPDQRYRTID